jgi:muramoyltetrapeptide carboxypeptidase
MPPFTRPPPLTRDSAIALLAPSSPFDSARFERGRALLEARYRPQLASSLFASRGFLAGADEARLADVNAALASAEVEALIPARGGYGATRLLPALEPPTVRRRAKWLVGFSDVTALHALWSRAGVCSIHGPMVCSLPDAAPGVQTTWAALLEGGTPPALEHLTCIASGRAEGWLFAGNLTVLGALLGTPYFPSLDGAVLALEDVGERPYRLDRLLTTFLQAGVLSGVRAIVLGQFTDCQPGADGTTADEVLRERFGSLGVPIVGDASFGHIADNVPLLLGSRAFVDAEAGVVSFADP